MVHAPQACWPRAGPPCSLWQEGQGQRPRRHKQLLWNSRLSGGHPEALGGWEPCRDTAVGCGRAPVVSSPDGIVTTWNKLGGTYEATCHLLNETGDLTLNLDCVFLVVEMDLHYAKYAPSLCPPYGISCNLGCHCESLIKVFLRETMTHRSKTHGSSWVCVALATEYGFDPECKLGFLPTLPHHLAEASSPSEGRRGPQLQNEGNNNLMTQVTVRIK